jgi:hypothetical protein
LLVQRQQQKQYSLGLDLGSIGSRGLIKNTSIKGKGQATGGDSVCHDLKNDDRKFSTTDGPSDVHEQQPRKSSSTTCSVFLVNRPSKQVY